MADKVGDKYVCVGLIMRDICGYIRFYKVLWGYICIIFIVLCKGDI